MSLEITCKECCVGRLPNPEAVDEVEKAACEVLREFSRNQSVQITIRIGAHADRSLLEATVEVEWGEAWSGIETKNPNFATASAKSKLSLQCYEDSDRGGGEKSVYIPLPQGETLHSSWLGAFITIRELINAFEPRRLFREQCLAAEPSSP